MYSTTKFINKQLSFTYNVYIITCNLLIESMTFLYVCDKNPILYNCPSLRKFIFSRCQVQRFNYVIQISKINLLFARGVFKLNSFLFF